MHILDCCQFSDIHISQGSVATYLWWNIYVSVCCKFITESLSERISKIGYGQEFGVFVFNSRCISVASVV